MKNSNHNLTKMTRCFICILFALLTITSLRAEESDWLIFPSAYPEQSMCKGRPMYFANPHETDITPQNSGYYEAMSNGMTLWRVGIASESAVNMNVILEQVSLLPEEIIKIYAPSRPEDAQEVTMMNLSADGVVQSQIVKGDSLIVEYWGRADCVPQLKITRVNCGFIDVDKKTTSGGANKVGNVGDSSSCEVDVTCYDMYNDVKQSICRLIIDGCSYGTGVLINNTSNDGTPYVVTAAHVLLSKTIKTCTADFNFEKPLCKENITNRDGEHLVSTVELVAYSEVHDMAVLKLGKKPDDGMMPYWAGWELSLSHEGIVHCIHHPKGDVRKVSQGKGVKAATYAMDQTNSGLPFVEDNHWLVGEWTMGASEAGSSGSGLFNNDMYLIGFLSGGSSTCSRPYSDYFWRLENCWNIADTLSSIKSLLDPKGTNVTRCDGAYHYDTDKHEQYFNIAIADPVVGNNNTKYSGYLAGHNGVRTTAIAERYDVGKTIEIKGIYITPRKVMTTMASSFDIKVWADDNGMPGAELYKKSAVDNATIKAARLNYVPFDTPLKMDKAFHIGIELEYGSAKSDTISVYYTLANNNDGARFKNNGVWERYSDVEGEDGLSCDLFIGCKAVVLSGESDDSLNKASVIKELNIQRKGDKLHINGEALKSATMYDVAGRKVAIHTMIGKGSVIIVDMSTVQKGIYLLKITSEHGESTVKVYEG